MLSLGFSKSWCKCYNYWNKPGWLEVYVFFYKNVHCIFNFIPNKLDTFDDKDPPWMTEKLSDKTQWKHKVYREYLKNGKTEPDYTLTKKLSNV